MIIQPSLNTPLPEGWVNARIQGYEEAEGQYGPQIRWTFNLGRVADVNGDVDDRTLTGYTSQKLSSKSKLWAWAKAAGLDPSQGVDLDQMVGQLVAINVTIRKGDDGGQYNKIESLTKPMPSQNGTAPPQAQPAQVADGPDGASEVPW